MKYPQKTNHHAICIAKPKFYNTMRLGWVNRGRCHRHRRVTGTGWNPLHAYVLHADFWALLPGAALCARARGSGGGRRPRRAWRSGESPAPTGLVAIGHGASGMRTLRYKLRGKSQTDAPVQPRNRREGAARGLGCGSRIGRGAATYHIA